MKYHLVNVHCNFISTYCLIVCVGHGNQTSGKWLCTCELVTCWAIFVGYGWLWSRIPKSVSPIMVCSGGGSWILRTQCLFHVTPTKWLEEAHEMKSFSSLLVFCEVLVILVPSNYSSQSSGIYFSCSGLDIMLGISCHSNSVSVPWILLFWFYCWEDRSAVSKLLLRITQQVLQVGFTSRQASFKACVLTRRACYVLILDSMVLQGPLI